MNFNFIIEKDGRMSLAAIFTSERLSAVALTFDGRVLDDSVAFYIMPSDPAEFCRRDPDCVETSGFDAGVLLALQDAVGYRWPADGAEPPVKIPEGELPPPEDVFEGFLAETIKSIREADSQSAA